MKIEIIPPKDMTKVGIEDLLRIVAQEIGEQQHTKTKGKVEYRGVEVAVWSSK